jgi:nicotinamidase-related amidase
MQTFIPGGAALLMAAFVMTADAGESSSKPFKLHTRRRVADHKADQPAKYRTIESTVEWNAKQTAIVICDMWDDHWCQGAARRVAELAGPMNKVVHAARRQGALIIHAPSSTVDFYQDTPQRLRAMNAAFARPPVPLSTDERWGTRWCWPDKQREPDLPIDDSDMGCDCAKKCQIRDAWTRQSAAIDIEPADAISDDGQEVYNLLEARGIKHVILMGVHLNMCVLGRPIGIRQLTYLGKDVVLMRDMTDTMYNSQKKPFVDHFTGTDLVIEHVEKYWCPTITSVDLVGGKPFKFQEDRRAPR